MCTLVYGGKSLFFCLDLFLNNNDIFFWFLFFLGMFKLILNCRYMPDKNNINNEIKKAHHNFLANEYEMCQRVYNGIH